MENSFENKRIEIGQEALGYLDTTRKWTMFFAILGFIGLGVLILAGIFAGSIISGLTSGLTSGLEGTEGMEGIETAKAAGGFAGVMILIVMLIFSAIYFFPLFYLLQFSRHTANAIKNLDAGEMTLAFKNIKSYWKYIGILVIIILAVYLIVFLIFGASMAFLGGLGSS